jgi:hypothetical protein
MDDNNPRRGSVEPGSIGAYFFLFTPISTTENTRRK